MTRTTAARRIDLEDPKLCTAVITAGAGEEREFLEELADGVIGHDARLMTPEGERPLRYFDYIASGRFHRAVEDELNERVLPFMTNTHSETSWTGRYMTHLYERALKRVGGYLNAADDDVVLPVGSGSTGAVNRLIMIMGLRIPSQLEDRYGLSKHVPERDRPVIFCSRMEHHSNDITWRETYGEPVYVEFDAHGRVSPEDLDAKLERYRDRPIKIGTFSAASNVTGIRNDCHALARVLHRHGGLAFFDFAAAGPYVEIDMHPKGANGAPDADASMDAVFLSMHKFLGGPRAPGLLIANHRLFSNRVPTEPGGGTVLYTSPTEHVYLDDASHRETGGTPPIVGAIQAGLAFDLKHTIGVDRIRRVEAGYLRRAIAAWSANPGLEILGQVDDERLAVVSLIFNGLHHNFAVALLSDYFGVQVRGGCMCAGPYGHELLQIDQSVSLQLKHQIEDGHCGVKPGWVRICFAPVTREEEFQALLEGVEFVSKHGREYLDRYELVDATGEWRRRG